MNHLHPILPLPDSEPFWVQISNSCQLWFCSLKPQNYSSLSCSSWREPSCPVVPFSLIVLKLQPSYLLHPVTAVCQISWTSGEKLRWVSDHPEADPEGARVPGALWSESGEPGLHHLRPGCKSTQVQQTFLHKSSASPPPFWKSETLWTEMNSFSEIWGQNSSLKLLRGIILCGDRLRPYPPLTAQEEGRGKLLPPSQTTWPWI